MTFTLKPTLFSLLTAGLVSACGHMATESEPATEPEVTSSEPSAIETDKPVTEKTNLTGESLFQLLLAEMSVNRHDYATAAVLYGEVGEKYNSVDALERATALNQTIGQFEVMHRQSRQWLALRPNDEHALQAVTLSSAIAGDLPLVIDTLNHWLSLNPDADISILVPGIEHLATKNLLELTDTLDELQTQYPESAPMYYTRSRLYYASGDKDTSAELAQMSMSIDKNLAASLFYFQLLLSEEKTKEAKRTIEKLVKAHPDNIQVAVQYTRYLYRYEPENLRALEVLHNRFGRDPVIARTYARAAFDQEAYDAAQAVYQHLLELGYNDESHYFLGRIDVINELTESAANHFEAVQQPPYLSSALAEWINLADPQYESRLLQKLDESRRFYPASAISLWRLQATYYHLTEQTDQAWATLEDALAEHPNDIELLYDQAMLATNLNRYSVLENNLSVILEIEPENFNAMNALGYTWADLNKNMALASEYIEKALTAEPENPAFQDSKGWYLYRTGNPKEALEWLQRAYKKMKNDEVAAHIAEVLWSLDRKDEAKALLEDIRQLNPKSKYLDYLNDLFKQ